MSLGTSMAASLLASVSFGVASGFLTVLVMMETPVRRLITDPANPGVRPDDIRHVQQAIHLIASSKAPTVPGLSFILGAACAAVQTWQRDFEVLSLVIAVLSALVLGLGLLNVGSVVKAALNTDAKGDIAQIRQTLRSEMIFHHSGWVCAVVLLLMQLGVVLS